MPGRGCGKGGSEPADSRGSAAPKDSHPDFQLKNVGGCVLLGMRLKQKGIFPCVGGIFLLDKLLLETKGQDHSKRKQPYCRVKMAPPLTLGLLPPACHTLGSLSCTFILI